MAEFDLFVVGGQSNAQGQGDSSASPDPNAGNAVEYINDTDTIEDPLTDPIRGNGSDSNTGSAWPQFAVDYHNLTGRKVALVGAFRSGSAQIAASDTGGAGTNWSSQENLRFDLVAYTNNATSALKSAGHTVNFQGVLWHQGEDDAWAIDDGLIVKSDYKAGLKDMISYFRGELGSTMPFWIFELGHETESHRGDSAGFQQVRAAQQEVALEQEHTFLVSDKQKDFPEQGYMMDYVHYDQTGLNIVGEVGALNVASRVDTTTRELSLLTGSESQTSAYTGASGEPVVNTTDSRLVVHDGSTQGGFPHAKESEI